MATYRQCLSRGISLSATVLLVGTAALAGRVQAAALTIGPVEQVNLKSSTIVVLGQSYRLDSSAHITDGTTHAAVALNSITPDTLVAVDGTESAAGKITVQNVVRLSQLNVPGATQLLVTGLVSAGSNVGQIRVGGLRIDINATLTGESQQPAVGQLVQAVGTQPASGGLFLAQGIIGTGASADGIIGTGVSADGIIGTGASAQGIIGTGLK